jgi:hypothetical protein
MTKLDDDIRATLKKTNLWYRERPDSNLADDELAHKIINAIANHYELGKQQDVNLLTNQQFEAILGTLKSIIISFLLSKMQEGEKKEFFSMSKIAGAVLDNPKPKEKWK